jgi:hypothetical protein
MEIISHSATNLPDTNSNSITIVHFKTTQSPTNFKGDCIAYVLGGSLISPSAIKVEQRNSPSTGKPFFYFYAYFGPDSQGTIIRTSSANTFTYQGDYPIDIGTLGSNVIDVQIVRIYNSKVGLYQSDISGLPQRLTNSDNTLANDYYTRNQLNNRLIDYDENSGSYNLNSRLVIRSATSGGGVVRILASISDSEASIGFYQNNSTASDTVNNNTWVIGNNSWQVGSGNLGIGCNKQGAKISINGNTGNINTTKPLSVNNSNVITQAVLDSNYYTQSFLIINY